MSGAINSGINSPVSVRGVPDAREERCPEGCLDALRAAFRGRRFPVYLWGEMTGTGKTYAAAVVYGKWLEKCDGRHWPRWAVWPEFADQAYRVGNGKSFQIEHEAGQLVEMNEQTFWQRWSTPELVVIDEVGLQSTKAHVEVMWRLLETRKNRPTILTGNLNEDEIRKTFDDRVFSRLREGEWIEVVGLDRRVDGCSKRNRKVGR